MLLQLLFWTCVAGAVAFVVILPIALLAPKGSKAVDEYFPLKRRGLYALGITIGTLVSIGLSPACGLSKPLPTDTYKGLPGQSAVDLDKTCVSVSTPKQINELRAEGHTVDYANKIWYVDGKIAGIGATEDSQAFLCWRVGG